MKLPQTAKKSLGQNFLIDKNIINKIIKIENIDKNKKILEIGAGYGNLTAPIMTMKICSHIVNFRIQTHQIYYDKLLLELKNNVKSWY